MDRSDTGKSTPGIKALVVPSGVKPIKIEVKMKFFSSDHVKPDNLRFYNITQIAYIFGALGHLITGFIFLWLKVYEMVWFNFLFSVPAFLFSVFINRRGRHNIAFSLAFTELLLHQALGVCYIGWNSGLQYFLIYLAGLTFFNAYWKKTVRLALISVVFFTYLILYLFYKIPEAYILTQPQYDFFYLTCGLSTILSMAILINYYVQAANKAETNLKVANHELSEKNLEIEQALADRNEALTLLNKELNEAADYVKTILPLPITQGDICADWRYIPSTSLGGDAFGYHWLDEDHFSMYLIDVSGHGVGAALLSVSVMNALRSQSLPHTDFKDPESVLNSLNIAFPGEENNDMFFTIWYGVYNKNTRELSYASGGHPPALLFDNGGTIDSTATLLRTPNYIIGGMPGVTYEKRTHPVGDDTKLYIFSDGVYEVGKSDGSMWRFQEFADFMNKIRTDSRSRLDRLYQHAKNIRKLENFEDDFTIVEVAFG
jgi:sigma-B regulation protein RsbU (phosphoserine phosphatase)